MERPWVEKALGQAGMVVNTCNPNTWQMETDSHSGYTASVRPVWAHRTLSSKKTLNKAQVIPHGDTK